MLFLPPLSSLPLKPEKGGLFLYVKATPKASKNALGSIEDGVHHPYLKVYIQSAPSDGEANKAIVALLSEKLKIPKSSILLKAGQTQRLKTFFLINETIENIAKKII